MKMNKAKIFMLGLVFLAAGCFTISGETLPWTLSGGPGKETAVLLLSDIHFDPFADGAAEELEKTDISGWRAVLEDKKPGEFPGYREDTNYRLFLSAINEISGISAEAGCAIICGDLICHNFEAKYRLSRGKRGSCTSFAVKTMEFVSLMIKSALPGKPVCFVMGNNDSDNGDYNIIPGGVMLGSLAGYFDTVKADARAKADFQKGGYYKLPFPGLENNELIVLNDIFWLKRYKRTGVARQNPGRAEMKWLKNQLDAAALNGKKAFIAMHVPPGIDAYLASKDKNCKGDDGFLAPGYNKEFFEIMKSHKAVVRNVFAGHTHFDDFRVFSEAGRPFMLVSIIPSISPGHGNNPAFELAFLKSSGEIKDKAVYFFSGYGGKDSGTPAKWEREYTFCASYGCAGYDPVSLYRLAISMNAGPDAMDKYLSFYTAGNPLLSLLLKQHGRIYGCALTSMDLEEYHSCACVGN